MNSNTLTHLEANNSFAILPNRQYFLEFSAQTRLSGAAGFVPVEEISLSISMHRGPRVVRDTHLDIFTASYRWENGLDLVPFPT